MKRAKKPKKPAYKKQLEDGKNIEAYVVLTNELNIAAMLRTLKMVYDWNDEEIRGFVESYIALTQEVQEGRCTLNQFLRDTTELTGFNPYTIFKECLG